MAIKFTSPIDLGNQRITAVSSPSVGTDAANKDYVDNVAAGLDWKASVRVASTGDIDLSAPGATIDGVSMSASDRFLAKDQSDGSKNGIYVWTGAATAATRATDANTAGKLNTGAAISVESGTVNDDKTFILITAGPITLDTTSLSFTVMNGGAGPTYTSGNGIAIAGSAISVDPDDGILVGGSGVAIDRSIVVAKFAQNVGDGSATSIVVTHNLNTRDAVIQVYTVAAPYETVYCEVQRTTVNTATVVFGSAPASGAYRVVVHA